MHTACIDFDGKNDNKNGNVNTQHNHVMIYQQTYSTQLISVFFGEHKQHLEWNVCSQASELMCKQK